MIDRTRDILEQLADDFSYMLVDDIDEDIDEEGEEPIWWGQEEEEDEE